MEIHVGEVWRLFALLPGESISRSTLPVARDKHRVVVIQRLVLELQAVWGDHNYTLWSRQCPLNCLTGWSTFSRWRILTSWWELSLCLWCRFWFLSLDSGGSKSNSVRYWRTSGLMQVLIFFSMGSGEAGINLSQIQAALTTGISYEGALISRILKLSRCSTI